MKRIVLIVSMLWLAGCAAADRSSPALTPAPIDIPASSLPARSVELSPSVDVTQAIDSALTPTFVARFQATAAAALPECPSLPAPTEVKSHAVVQHFEHGLMFWLQDRNEIWTLIATPLQDQFSWRILPNLWSEGQPENDAKLLPPADRFQPVRGFGVAWRLGGGSYGPQRADLGWARDEEIGFDTALIYYPQGFYSPDCTWMPKSGIYELRDERGAVYQFVGAGGIAKIVTP